jgi:hypothetical protein
MSNMPDYQQTLNRNYDAEIGRFVAVDPDPESAEDMTVYQYAGNNPVMMNDPSGGKAAAGGYGAQYGTNHATTGFGNTADEFAAQDMLNAYEGNYDYFTAWSIITSGPNGLSGGSQTNYGVGNGQGDATTQGSYDLHWALKGLANVFGLNLTNQVDALNLQGRATVQSGYEELDDQGALVDAGVIDFTFKYSINTNANQGGMTHAQELEKYGTITDGNSRTYTGVVGKHGFIFEYGTVRTSKGYSRRYQT